MKRIIQVLSSALAIVSAVATLGIMVLTVVDVSSRWLGAGSIPGLLEMSEVLLVFMVFCGIAYGLQTRTHVAVTLLTSRLPRKLGKVVVSGGLLALLALLVWILFASGEIAIESAARQEARFGIASVPIWPARVIIPLGFLVLIGEVVIQLIQILNGQEAIQGELPDEVEVALS